MLFRKRVKNCCFEIKVLLKNLRDIYEKKKFISRFLSKAIRHMFIIIQKIIS